jgi:hypothetical protein
MNRKAIRVASKELGLKQPTTAMQLLQPNCDKESKPGMRSKATNELIWKRTVHYQDRRRHWESMAICCWRIEWCCCYRRSFCQIQFEITLLTVVQNNNPTCAPIGHRQERGDYSWQPATILDKDLYEAKDGKKLPKP